MTPLNVKSERQQALDMLAEGYGVEDVLVALELPATQTNRAWAWDLARLVQANNHQKLFSRGGE